MDESDLLPRPIHHQPVKTFSGISRCSGNANSTEVDVPANVGGKRGQGWHEVGKDIELGFPSVFPGSALFSLLSLLGNMKQPQKSTVMSLSQTQRQTEENGIND